MTSNSSSAPSWRAARNRWQNTKQRSTPSPQQNPEHQAADGTTVTLKGSVKKILFRDHTSGFTIFSIAVAQEAYTVTGTIVALACGQEVEIEGSWVTHPKFGRQIALVRYSALVPTTPAGLVAYLGSGMIKGIGPAVAERIVNMFGSQTLDVIDTQPERLTMVPGIGSRRLEAIATSWKEHKNLARVIMFLQERGLSTTYAIKLTQQYRERAIEVLEQNPYQLIDDVWGIGFSIADTIAQKMGVRPTSPLRCEAALKHALQQALKQGHLYLTAESLRDQAIKLLELAPEDTDGLIMRALETLHARDITIVPPGQPALIGLRSSYNTEAACAQKLHDIQALTRICIPPRDDVMLNLNRWCATHHITLAPEQHDAIMAALYTGVSIITGGPGTGKTTLVRALIALLEECGATYKLAAPTGRAAKRLHESTGSPASTIHRLLELGQDRNDGIRQWTPVQLKAQYIIIDECSMIDIYLAHALLQATMPGSQLILIGDIDQLPPVGPGNFLRDSIASQTIPTVRLVHIFRQAEKSLITVNAHRVREGESLATVPAEGGDRDFYFITEPDPEQCAPKLRTLMQELVARRGFSHHDIMVLCPMNRGQAGTQALNAAIQTWINGQEPLSFTSGLATFRRGDRVMQIRNNYEKDVFNGDIGSIAAIDTENATCTVSFDGKEAIYEFSEAEELTLAYATSVHKSQGSEFPVVIIPIFMQHFMMLRRNLLYTAITRAKKLCILIGERKAAAIAIRSEGHSARATLLHQLLRAGTTTS